VDDVGRIGVFEHVRVQKPAGRHLAIAILAPREMTVTEGLRDRGAAGSETRSAVRAGQIDEEQR